MASSAKALGELLRSPKRLRPHSLSPESMSLKSPLSSLCTPPLAAGEHSSALTSEQAKRVDDDDRSIARWKRNLSICSERIAITKADGMEYVKLGELLVEETWLEALPGELQKPYAQNLCRFVEMEMRGSVPIYPPPHLIFNALHSTPFDEVKAVIIGQDPYHGPGQAMGLAFSVPEGIKIPSSLLNMFKELRQDVGCSLPSHGNLERWALQGILLLNTVLTVREHQVNSHAKKGWELFTDTIIQTISQHKTGVIFLLWGISAQVKSRRCRDFRWCCSADIGRSYLKGKARLSCPSKCISGCFLDSMDLYFAFADIRETTGLEVYSKARYIQVVIASIAWIRYELVKIKRYFMKLNYRLIVYAILEVSVLREQ